MESSGATLTGLGVQYGRVGNQQRNIIHRLVYAKVVDSQQVQRVNMYEKKKRMQKFS
jgi:hypothetical protein